jgi:hypothetical protein
MFFLASSRCSAGDPVSLGPEADDKPLVRRDGLIAIVQPCLFNERVEDSESRKTIYKSFATGSENEVFSNKESHLTRVWDKERRNGSWQFQAIQHRCGSFDAAPVSMKPRLPAKHRRQAANLGT